MTVTSITTSNDGLTVTVNFDGSETYSSGSITFHGAPRIGFTSSIASSRSTHLNRRLKTYGAPTSGDGTAVHVYSLKNLAGTGGGQIPWEAETLTADVPAGFTSGGSEQLGLAVTNNASAATNAVCNGAPLFATRLTDLKWYEDASLTVQVDAQGLSGAGDGVVQISITASDGVNSDQTFSATEITAYTAPDGGAWRAYQVGPFDMTAFNYGDVTFTVTATGVLGTTRVKAYTVKNFASGAQGTPLDHEHYYIDQVSGNDVNNGLTTGTAVATIGRAINLARLNSGLDLTTFHFISAGTYDVRGGDSGVPFVGIVKLQADIAGVYINGTRSNGINPRVTGSLWWTSSDPSTHRINAFCLANDDPEELISIRVPSYADSGCRFTQEQVTTTIDFGVAYIIANNTRAFLDGALIEDIYTFGQTAPVSSGFDVHAWHIRGARITADPHNNFETVVDSQIIDLGQGVPAFNVSYTGAGTATIERTGLASDQPGTKSLVLSVDASPVLTMDLNNASYDTVAEVVAAIDALTDWSAATEADHARYPSVDIWPFSEIEVTSTPTIICTRNVHHADLYQVWGPVPRSIYLHAIEAPGHAKRPGEGSGSIGEQTLWFDHAGPLNLTGVLVKNISDPMFLTSTPTPRAGFHGVLNNVLVMQNTLPDSRIGFVYSGAGSTPNSEFVPTNFTLAHNIAHSLYDEDGNSAEEVDYFNNHWAATGLFEQIQDVSDTTGAVTSYFTQYVDEDNYDLTPVSGSPFLSRLAAAGSVDSLGKVRLTLGSIGAVDTSPLLILSVTGAPDGTYDALVYKAVDGGDEVILYQGAVTFSGEQATIDTAVEVGDKVFTLIYSGIGAPLAIAENTVE